MILIALTNYYFTSTFTQNPQPVEMEETGVIARAAGRIEALMSQLGISWAFVRDLFLGIWNKLSIESLINPIATFIQIVSQFKEPIVRLLKFTIEVIKIVLDLVMQLMNFPPGIVGRIINNAMQAFEDIKKNPVGFLLNLLKAVKTGFLKFFDNILKHLLGGVSDWLFGQLGKAGIEVPKDFTLPSILKLVFQVLDITMDKMWKKLADRIGQPTVDKIRGAIDKLVGIWNFVKDVQQRGMAAIWEYIQGQISNLWDMVLGFVRDWIMKKIVEKVVTKLLSMLDPTGIMAVVNSFIAFFNAVQSAIEYFRQILEIVDSFVGTVAEIARGSVDRAAQFLENLLARSLPVAIGFLANQVGLGSVGDKIQEIIAGVRGVVDKALDWLVDQAVKLGRAALNALGLGQKDGTTNGAVKEPFSMGEASHTLTATLENDTVVITMASGDDITVSVQLGNAISLIEDDKEVDDKGQPIKRQETQKAKILSTLKGVKIQVDNIRPPKGEAGVSFENFIKPKLAYCIGQLSQLAKYKPAITSLKPLIVIGQPRYIPKTWDIRKNLYDKTTGSGWQQLSKQKRDDYIKVLSPKLYEIWKLRDDKSNSGNYAKAEAEWVDMQSKREIPSPKNAPTFATYNHPKHFNQKNPYDFRYETDHDPSLGTSWNNGEKNKTDADRKQTTLNSGNLRVITWEENNERSNNPTVNPKFQRDVGSEFSSDVAFSPKGSMTIDGIPFDDKPS